MSAVLALKHGLVRAARASGAVDVALKLLPASPVILLYHGVTDRAPEPGRLRNADGKHIRREDFARHLAILKRHRRVLPLPALVEGLREGRDLAGAVAITFDDGYENHWRLAAPLLADANLPATFFLTTGLVGGEAALWTDRLEAMLDHTAAPHLRAPDGARLPVSTAADRARALAALKAQLKPKPLAATLAEVDRLAREAGCDPAADDAHYRFMSWRQARELAAGGFDIGAHTVNHPILSTLPEADARAEILQSLDDLRRELGPQHAARVSPVFCYPNGKAADVTASLKAFCRAHFSAALSAERGPALATDLYALKRLSSAGGPHHCNLEWLLLRER